MTYSQLNIDGIKPFGTKDIRDLVKDAELTIHENVDEQNEGDPKGIIFNLCSGETNLWFTIEKKEIKTLRNYLKII